MTKTPSKDPMSMWREMLSTWERQVNEFGNKMMGTEQFGAVMNKSSVIPLQMQKMQSDLMARHLSSMNLPSRDDITALGERLSAVEQAIMKLTRTLDVKNGNPAYVSPPRTRKPPAAKGQSA